MSNQEEIKPGLESEQETVCIEEPKLGKMVFNKFKSWFECEADWLGNPCTICLETDEDGSYSIKMALDAFWKLYGNLSEWDKRLKNCAAEKLIGMANEWSADLEDEPKEITKEMFVESMKISELIVWCEGNFTITYNIGNIFYGHEIMIDANIDGSMKEIDVVG